MCGAHFTLMFPGCPRNARIPQAPGNIKVSRAAHESPIKTSASKNNSPEIIKKSVIFEIPVELSARL